MAVRFLDDSSFSVLRTNPKLSTNIKLVVDSSDNLYLESFDANEELSSSKFKAFKIDPKSSYEQDISAFYNNGKFPVKLAYEVFQANDDLSVLPKYGSQYENFYSAGTTAINSEFFREDLGILAPLWIDGTIPDYFVIFKLDGPVAVNNARQTDASNGFNSANSAEDFKKNVLEKASTVATFDLRDGSNLGTYLRNYAAKPGFPKSPMNVTFKKDELTTWNGISYENGSFASKGEIIYEEFVIQDKSIIESEYYLTKGFERHGMVCANLINMQFLFSDAEADEYTMNRYFGLYVSEVKEGEFALNGAEFYRKATVENQLPRPTREDDISPLMTDSFVQENLIGNLLHIKDIETTTDIPTHDIVNSVDSIFYVKNKDDNFYNIKTGGVWGTDQVRLANKTVDMFSLTGFDDPETYVPVEILSTGGRAMSWFSINDTTVPHAYSVDFFDNFIPIGQIACDSSLTVPGENNYQYFSNAGTVAEIAESMAKAINSLDENLRYFDAIAHENQVILRSRAAGSRFNRINFSINPALAGSYITFESDDDLTGVLKGGSNTNQSRLKVAAEFFDKIEEGYYGESETSYVKIVSITKNIENPARRADNTIREFTGLDDYYTIVFESDDVKIDSVKRVAIYKEFKPSFGRFSLFPVKDFDFDFYSEEYGKEGELRAEIDEYNTYIENTGGVIEPYLKASHPDIIDFYQQGFGRLQSLLNRDSAEGSVREEIFSEYDRLKENYIKELSNTSRLIPYINKWVYKDGKDVRELDYRLNSSSAFGIYNFSPSKDAFEPDSDAFTHEWYYLSQIPEYFSSEHLKNSWSYFDQKIRDNQAPLFLPFIPGFFQDITVDNFSDYFIVDRLNGPEGPVSLDRQIRYSNFAGGNGDKFAETFFRGIKVIAKKRSESDTEVNFNINSIPAVRNTEYNGYKFSAVLIPHEEDKPAVQVKFVKNDKWKTITMMVFLRVNYDYFDGSSDFVDRTMLYALKSNIVPGSDGFSEILGGGYQYADTIMDGAIDFQHADASLVSGIYTIKGGEDDNGVPTNFTRDIQVGADGRFNRITFSTQGGANNFIIDDIIEVVNENTIKAAIFTNNNAPLLALPTLAYPPVQWRNAIYTVESGGYQLLKDRMRDVSFASIYEMVNQGRPDVVYESVDDAGNITYNDYLIELRAPDLLLKGEYITAVADEEKPVQFNLTDLIGYRISLDQEARIIPFYRHSGKYTPKFVDVFKFIDPYLLDEYDTHGLSSYEESVFNLTRYANTQLNTSDADFGKIKNMFYHKVNVSNPGSVLELSETAAFNSLYPLINEIAIDTRDAYVFSSNWDPGYFVESVNKSTSNYEIGTKSSLEKKSFFGSKYLKVPQTIEIPTFTVTDFNELAINDSSIIPETSMYREDRNKIEMFVFLSKSITDFVFDHILLEFQRYVNPAFGFGTIDDVSDDAIEYIRLNVLPLYKIESIDLYLKSSRNNNGTAFTYLGSSNATKKEEGLGLTKNFSVTPIGSSNFDFSLIYNKIIGFSHEIGISVTLIKK